MICLCDNQFGDSAHRLQSCEDGVCRLNGAPVYFRQRKNWNDVHAVLHSYSGRNITELQELSHGNLFIQSSRELDFPLYSLKEDDDNVLEIETGNAMGVVCLREKGHCLKVQIHSRFDRGNRQYFLNYLLSRVFDVNFADFVSASDDAMWELLLALSFIRKFRMAAEIGLYKQYHTMEYNDLNFRGKLDLDRHLKRNYPLCDRIAYSKREITFDNPLNHLFRSAFRKIERKWPAMLERDGEMQRFLTALKQATPSWNESETSRLLDNPETCFPVRHPFFAESYEPLRRNARMLLLDEGADVFESDGTTSDQEVAGVIFDGSWLWEEYIATVLTDFTHAVYPKIGGISVFNEFPRYKFYPDFLNRDKTVVLDAKYKRGSQTGQSSDIHQVLCYMFLTGATCGGLIYPPRENMIEERLMTINAACCCEKKTVWINYSFDPIPVAVRDNATKFIEYMKGQEEKLKKHVAVIQFQP